MDVRVDRQEYGVVEEPGEGDGAAIGVLICIAMQNFCRCPPLNFYETPNAINNPDPKSISAFDGNGEWSLDCT